MAKPAWLTKEKEEQARRGSYEELKLGGHRCYIVGMQPYKSRDKGLNMWIIQYDTLPDDKQPLYYRKLWDGDARADKKWRGSCYYTVDESAYFMTKEGRQSFYGRDNLARFTTAIEDSNPDFVIDWNQEACTEEFLQQFKGKYIGIVFGREFYNDPISREARSAVKPRYFCKIEGVEDRKVPKDKDSKKPALDTDWTPAAGEAGENGFMQLADELEDEGLPFNT